MGHHFATMSNEETPPMRPPLRGGVRAGEISASPNFGALCTVAGTTAGKDGGTSTSLESEAPTYGLA